MRFTESFISELKARNPLEDVLNGYITLKRAGSNMVACCPFHNERTPSFTVFSQGDHYYCFGCGAGGDVITFIMKMENLDYPAAVEYLANRAGMQLPQSDEPFRPRVDKNRFYEMNKKAARFFYDSLYRPENSDALKYAADRGLDKHTIRHFGIGYADTSWDSLTRYLLGEGFKEKELTEGFLSGAGKNGRLYDIFRGRLIFPIIDVTGNVVAFNGRTTINDERKYVNSKDTPVFKKGKTLYCLNIAKDVKKNSFILCEGPMDTIAMHKAGFTNALATLGTALTNDHARLISRYAEKVYLCYDSDEAGQRATKKAIDILNSVGIESKVIRINGAKDPDEYISKFGKASFQKLLDDADGHIDYKISVIKAKYDLTLPEQVLRFVNEACRMLSGISSGIEREIYIKKISAVSSISEEAIRAEVNRIYKSKIREIKKERVNEDIDKSLGYRSAVNSERAKNVGRAAKEENLIGILLLHPEYMADKTVSSTLTKDTFKGELMRKIYEAAAAVFAECGVFDPGMLGESLTADEVGTAFSMYLNRKKLENNSVSVAVSLIEQLNGDTSADKNLNDEEIRKLMEKRREQKR